jgi:hypothetical protein
MFICCCEHEKHDSPNESVHPMFQMVHGEQWNAAYVGSVCADCAAFCIPEQILGKVKS